MLAKILSAGLIGVDGYVMDVEVDITNGLPGFELVGLPDATVKESRERVRSAIKNSGFYFPTKRIIVNMAPADTRKEGPAYDLPIAIGILMASGQLTLPNEIEPLFLGELSLDGTIRPVSGVLPMLLSVSKQIKSAVLSSGNAMEGSHAKEMDIFTAANLRELVFNINSRNLTAQVRDETIFEENIDYIEDFDDVKGQEGVKRALELAASGGHNILMIGPPGSGKTMLARRLPTILPDLTWNEAIEATKISSAAGMLDMNDGIVKKRAFRAPHHTISHVALVGGGRFPKPGEVSLAHNGVLFLDEMPEFSKDALEVLRQPLEDGKITISRANGTVTFPANFMLVGSMNPCPCGYYGDMKHSCSCGTHKIKRYLNKISGPLLDRFDIHTEVPAVDFEKLSDKRRSESSADIKKRVDSAKAIQLERYKDNGIYSNAQLSGKMIAKYCSLTDGQKKMLKFAFDRMNLSARAYDRILKLSRTIADMDGRENIEDAHLAEAIQYRSLDRQYWDH